MLNPSREKVSFFLFTISQKPIIHFAGRREIVRTMENY